MIENQTASKRCLSVCLWLARIHILLLISHSVTAFYYLNALTCNTKCHFIFTNCTGKFLSMTSDGLSAVMWISGQQTLHGFHDECSHNAESDDVPFAGDVATTAGELKRKFA